MAEANLTRLEALSDGVFSVALTLLLLEIRPKDHPGVQPFDDDWWHEVFLNSGLFAAAFFLVGIYWVAHKRECAYLLKTDRIAEWLNLAFLAAVAILPFSVSVLAGAWMSHLNLERAVRLYVGNMFCAGCGLFFFFLYSARARHGWLNNDGVNARSETIRRNLILPALSVAVLSCFEIWEVFRIHFLAFVALMASAPTVYFLITLAGWLRKRWKRVNP